MAQSSSSNEENAKPLSQKFPFEIHGSPTPSMASGLLFNKDKVLTVEDLRAYPRVDLELLVVSACSAGLLNTPEACKADVMHRVQTYVKQSKQKKRLHNILQLIIFIGAALVTVTLAIPDIPKLVPALLGGIITVATAIANYYKFGERSRDLFLVAEELGLEHNRFNTMRGIYKNLSLDEAFPLFMDRVERIISEDTKRSFALETVAAKAVSSRWDSDKNGSK